MTITTSRGATLEARRAAYVRGLGTLSLTAEPLPLSELAAALDGLDWLEDDAGTRWNGPFTLTRLIRDDRIGAVYVTMLQGSKEACAMP